MPNFTSRFAVIHTRIGKIDAFELFVFGRTPGELCWVTDERHHALISVVDTSLLM